MTFYTLHLPDIESERLVALEKACKDLKIPFKALDPYSFDFSQSSPFKKDDMMYRVSRGKLLRMFENYLLNDAVTTFYRDSLPKRRDPFTLMKEGIVSPRTIFCATNDRSRLQHYVNELGGFPVVVKVLGGTHGVGVMKVDSFPALYGIIDFILAQNRLVILREFIPVTTSARFIVLGNKVIASLEYHARANDFRSNVSDQPRISVKLFDKDLENLAIKATAAMGLEFGGVDILIHKDQPYVTEVNFPCNFVRAQNLLKKDIAREMVKYLQMKNQHSKKVSKLLPK